MRIKLFKPTMDASKREEILNAAQNIFANVGFKEATIRQICKQAKANVCLISYYFGGKDELYKAIFERSAQSRVSEVRSILGVDNSQLTSEEFRFRLKMVIQHMYNSMSSQPDFFKLMGREMIDGMPRASEIIKKNMGESLQFLIQFIEIGQKKKFIKKDLDPQLVAQSIVNIMLGFTTHLNLNDNHFFFRGIPAKEIPDRIVKTVSTLFLDGVTQ